MLLPKGTGAQMRRARLAQPVDGRWRVRDRGLARAGALFRADRDDRFGVDEDAIVGRFGRLRVVALLLLGVVVMLLFFFGTFPSPMNAPDCVLGSLPWGFGFALRERSIV